MAMMAHEKDTSHPEPSKDGPKNLVKLQSKDHDEILDVIDQLRSEGIGKYVDLPQLIVCGDQSSGKSSVLEAISGLGFPTKDNICTRFATELILRRAPDSGVTASIYPDDERPFNEKERLRNFTSPTLALDQFEKIVKSAEDAIGVSKDGLSFSKDILRVEVYGPMQPHLTLVDLPGLYHAPDESQNEEGVQFVESLVLSYMENRRSVMLAVISAKNDIALQKVTAFTRKLDAKGERTMGIITKPDTLPSGSDMEQSFFNLAQNKRMPFRLGWHILKNRTFEERGFSLEQRCESEATFLSQGIWSAMPRNLKGINALRPRLSEVLKDHILSQMAGFVTETRSSLNDTLSNLEKLGEPRQTLTQQRQYLLRGSERFTSLTTAAVRGMYSDPFFGDAMTDAGYQKRLRAVIQNCLTDFSDSMRDNGEQRKIVADDDDDDDDDAEELDHDETPRITRSDFIKEVQKRARRSRGQELPGTFNPLIIGDLFFEHCRPWPSIVEHHTGLMLEAARESVTHILQDVFVGSTRTAEKLLKHIVNPSLAKLEIDLRDKVVELLQPHRSGGHPITYNHYFIATIQETREQHLRTSIAKRLEDFFGDVYPSSTPNESSKFRFSPNALIEALSTQQGTTTDMEEFACSEAIDYMLAYYKVARKKLVDDIAVLAIESHLVTPLLHLYSPVRAILISDKIVAEIAMEDETTSLERERLKAKVGVLTRCMDILHRLDLRGFSSTSATATSTAAAVTAKGIDALHLNETGPATTASTVVGRNERESGEPRPDSRTPSRDTSPDPPVELVDDTVAEPYEEPVPETVTYHYIEESQPVPVLQGYRPKKKKVRRSEGS